MDPTVGTHYRMILNIDNANEFVQKKDERITIKLIYYNLTFIVVVLTKYIFHSGFICIPFEML